MWISEDMAAELSKGGVRPALLYRIAAVPVVRAWTGVGNLAIAADDIETTDGAIYKGVGAIRELPEIEVLLNMGMGRLVLSLSGVSAEVLAMVEADAGDVMRKPVHIGVIFLGPRHQMIGGPLWPVEGLVEEVFTDEERSQRIAGLQIGYGATERRTPALSFLSPTDQEARHAGDAFCARTPLYDAGRGIVWPTW